jgi:hypothetical protein
MNRSSSLPSFNVEEWYFEQAWSNVVFEYAYKKEYTMWLEQKPNLKRVGKISLTKHGGV